METYGRERREQMPLPIDRLSKLPDATLRHILSFLPTKASVATSILARRWRFLWAHVPNLDFDFDGPENHPIINRVLLMHKLPSLKSLSISIYMQDDTFDELEVQTWITAAIKRNVQYLHLFVACHYALPSRLFTCETVVDLTLSDCGEIPLLEYLRIESNFKVHFGFSCHISSPTVKRLYLESLVGSIAPLTQGYIVEIDTPELEYMWVDDYLLGPIECGNLTSLTRADISHRNDEMVEDMEHDIEEEDDDSLGCVSLFTFVDSLSSVKSLKLDLSDYSTIIGSLLSAWTPIFDNLTKLKLIADSCFLSKFLESANNLEILELGEQRENLMSPEHQFGEQTRGWIEPQQVPKCLLSSLTTIKIGNIVCTEDGLKIVRYLLRSAKVLKMMDITYPPSLDSEAKNDLLQKISLFERVSEACELTFTEASSDDSSEWDWERISV